VLVTQSIQAFQEVYDTLGVLLTPQDVVGESAYNDQLPEVLAELEAKGLLVEDQGARCVFPPGFTNRDGQPLPLIVQKSDGGFGYAATDLAAIRDRVQRLGARRLLYVVGAPQAQHLQMCFAVARMAGWLPEGVQAEHVAFGSVLGPDGKMFRTRAGGTVKLADLLAEAVARAEAALAARGGEGTDPEERRATARALGIGAVKYADLATERTRDYVFDWDRMLAFEGNTGPYVQYAHARIRSIFRRAETEPPPPGTPITLGAPEERALALALVAFPRSVAEVAQSAYPHRLCQHLSELASAFTAFYEACPVLRADDESTRSSRLALCDLTARVLAQGLGLLGITAPERM
jgi:arginyl-tRNA synthetase